MVRNLRAVVSYPCPVRQSDCNIGLIRCGATSWEASRTALRTPPLDCDKLVRKHMGYWCLASLEGRKAEIEGLPRSEPLLFDGQDFDRAFVKRHDTFEPQYHAPPLSHERLYHNATFEFPLRGVSSMRDSTTGWRPP